MRFQPRDTEILKVIYESDGVIARRHLKDLFWSGKTTRAMEQRLSKLKTADYITWPSREQRRHNPNPEPICWLGWRGALSIAEFYGKKIDPPKSDNEYQMRSLQKKLREAGIRWVREPHWIQLAHNLTVIDFKLAMDMALNAHPNLYLQKWLPEGYFRSALANQNNYPQGAEKPKKNKKGIIPDGYFEIIDVNRMKWGEDHKARFLLEIDMATHDNPSFGREKVIPGIEYIRSIAYKNQFGWNNGHWLVVTKGHEKRLANLMKQVEKHAVDDSELFFLTTFEQIGDSNLLIEPIWWQAGIDKPVTLLD